MPKITTVDTATAVLWGSQRTTPSAPSTAAAPQIELPVAVISAVSASIFIRRPSATPSSSVATTTTASTAMAGRPMAATWANVSRKP